MIVLFLKKHGMPAVVETDRKEGPPKDVTSKGDLLFPGPGSQELSPQPE